jgi:HSP20 family protein
MLVRFERIPMARPVWRNVVEFEHENRPAIDLVEQQNESVVVVELPGVAKEDVKITMEEDMLTIKGERKTPGLADGARWIRSERSGGEFLRTIRLPHAVKGDAVSAELVNGILRITLPKAEEARPREIGIK